jgi:Outer membrane lipoprotein carrier protein LolA-like
MMTTPGFRATTLAAMRSAVILAFVATLTLAAPCRADIADVCPTLAPGQTLYGRFVQQRYLKGLTAPLKTQGDFVVSPAAGIIWRVNQPVRSITVITAAGMRRITDGDVQRLASSKVPAYAHMYASLADAITGNWAALRQDFTVAYTGDRHAWRVILTPLQSTGSLSAHLTSVILTGGARIDTVDINHANGDSEQVAFLNQVVSNTPLSEPDTLLLRDKPE